MNEQTKDRKDLKIQALLEKVASLTASYEDQVADLRVELTIVSQELEEYKNRETPDKSPNDEVHEITTATP